MNFFKKILVFIGITYFSLNFIVPEFYEKDVVKFCSNQANSSQFVNNSKFRNCIIDNNYRNKIIDDLVSKQNSEKILLTRYWKKNFEKNNDIFIGNVKNIGYEKFEGLEFLLPRSIDFEYKQELPTFIKVRMNCNLIFDSCHSQQVKGKEIKEYFGEFDISKFIDSRTKLAVLPLVDVLVDLYLITSKGEFPYKYELSLMGFNIVDLDSIVEGVEGYNVRMITHYESFR
jgi:hypothetical protein